MTDDKPETACEPEIELGELREEQPETSRRPDQNKHFKVLPVFAPGEADLPIFVDLDTLRDMEEHAATDTRVELGGVLLGGQYQDDAGRPFVVVSDCLRAEHYEATKGSFKFTHDTWQQISRERDEFPTELQMVGWYHTHPGWGVFLSGMDLFICENFFNRSLDLALVIDPCGHDRGFFQWTSQSHRRVRRTDGYYLFASRFREWELAQFVEWLEEQPMSTDPRFRGGAATGAAPVVQLASQPTVWQALAVLGTLTLQFCLLALIAWRILLPSDEAAKGTSATPDVQASIDRVTAAQLRQVELDAKVAVLDDIIRQGGGTPDGLVAALTERAAQMAKLENDLQAHRQFNETLKVELTEARRAARVAKQAEDRLVARINKLREDQTRLKSSESQATADGEVAAGTQGWSWPWMALATIVGLLCGGGVVASLARPQQEEEVSAE